MNEWLARGDKNAFPNEGSGRIHDGLTRRELFALEMAKAWRISEGSADFDMRMDSQQIARLGLHDADALIAALDAKP